MKDKAWYKGEDRKEVKKVIQEQHFCPLCDEPSVKYHFDEYEDGTRDICNIDTKWYFTEHENIGLELILQIDKEDENFDIVFKLNNRKIKNLFYRLNEEYKKTYNCENITAFCSERCLKLYLLNNNNLLKNLKVW